MKKGRNNRTRGMSINLALAEMPVDVRFLSLIGREQIHELRSPGVSRSGVGRALGQSPLTIGSGLRGNTTTRDEYLPCDAHRPGEIAGEFA